LSLTPFSLLDSFQADRHVGVPDQQFEAPLFLALEGGLVRVQLGDDRLVDCRIRQLGSRVRVHFSDMH
jgi:hypothetical protein